MCDSFPSRLERTITAFADIPPTQAQQVQPRAIGRALISAKARDGLSVLADLKTQGCLKTLFPHGSRDRLTSVLLNTAGGITGGDHLHLHAGARAGSRLCLTTQAAERIYRAQPGQTGHVDTRLTIDADARIDWLPQETILFNHAALERSLRVDMAPNARLLAVEPLILGRIAMGETLTATRLTDRIQIRRGGDLVFADTLRLTTETLPRLTAPALLGENRALASVLFIAPQAEAHLPALRALMPASGGVSLIRPGVLFARILAQDSFLLRQSLIPVLTHLNGAPLPRTWMI